jgi:hypothetical protein
MNVSDSSVGDWAFFAFIMLLCVWTITDETCKAIKRRREDKEPLKMARHTQKVVRTRSIEDLTDDEYDAIIKGLQVIVEVNERPVDEEDDELEEPTKEYPAAKRLLAQLEEGDAYEVTTGDGQLLRRDVVGGGVAMSADDPRGGPDDPVGMPTRSSSGTGGGPFTRRPRD